MKNSRAFECFSQWYLIGRERSLEPLLIWFAARQNLFSPARCAFSWEQFVTWLSILMIMIFLITENWVGRILYLKLFMYVSDILTVGNWTWWGTSFPLYKGTKIILIFFITENWALHPKLLYVKNIKCSTKEKTEKTFLCAKFFISYWNFGRKKRIKFHNTIWPLYSDLCVTATMVDHGQSSSLTMDNHDWPSSFSQSVWPC